MKTTKIMNLLVVMLVSASSASIAQSAVATENKEQSTMETKTMNTYVIEREIPDAGNLKAEDLQGVSKTSCDILKDLGPTIEWVHSYVTGNKVFCIYRAENEEILRTHAQKGGFPINAICKVSAVISPATATAPLAEIQR